MANTTKVQTFTKPTKSTSNNTAPISDFGIGRTQVLSGKYTVETAATLSATTDYVEYQVGYAPANSRLLRAYVYTSAPIGESSKPIEVNIGTDTTATYWFDGLDFGATTASQTAIDKHFCDASSSYITGPNDKVVIKLIGSGTAATILTSHYLEWVFEFVTP